MLRSHHTPHLLEAGLDEVGRGCLAGPVVAAAVILPPNYHHSILTDSKQLTHRQRDKLQVDIRRDAVAWAIAEVSPADIDRINILQASFLACTAPPIRCLSGPNICWSTATGLRLI